LTEATDHFSVGIEDSDGQWPTLPQTWSYSSLREATECPRRWMLSRAKYPDLWSHWGYPPRPSLPALIGDVVHGVLETLLRSFRSNGCTSLADPAMVGVLKDLGGYTALVEHGIEEQLDRLAENPRINDRLGPLRTALRVKVPEIRRRVQAVIARMPFQSVDSGPESTDARTGRGPLPYGFHPEVELRVPSLRLAGRADLMSIAEDTCEITDYKTGAPDPHHADQLRLYALLWSRDHELNPQSLPIRRLILSYPSHDVDVEPLTAAELEDVASSTTWQIHSAEAALRERPPPAYPDPAMCGLCNVRQLCAEYWTGLQPTPVGGTAETDWFDFEGTVSKQNGARSWLLAANADDASFLLRTSSETVPFKVGEHLRLLNLRREEDPEGSLPIGTLTQASEIFIVSGSD
jgi:hypothetical protein